MARVSLDLPKIRLEMAGLILNDWKWMMHIVDMKNPEDRLQEELVMREKSTWRHSYQRHP